jgi:uncharacterized repeat protein (TIGR01451 family)
MNESRRRWFVLTTVLTTALAVAVAPARVFAAPAQDTARASRVTEEQSPPALPPDVAADWWSEAQQAIRAAEYRVTWQEVTGLADLPAAWQAPNRAHGLRAYFVADGVRVVPRSAEGPAWEFRFSLASFGRVGRAMPAAWPQISTRENRIEYQRDGLVEWLVNDPRGLEHGFRIEAPPEGAGPLTLDLSVGGVLLPSFQPDGSAVDFLTPTGVRVLRYSELHVTDASGIELPARLEPWSAAEGRGIRIAIDDGNAVYPLNVDPLLTSPSWTAKGNQVLANFGSSVATAGDVNGDGFSDLVVGAPRYDNGQTDEGMIFAYYGSASGLPGAPSWTAEGNQSVAFLGSAVATAGDVNGDGFSDLLVGASHYDHGQIDEGAAFVFLGSAGGLELGGARASGSPANADWMGESNQSGAHLGGSLSTAGDVNGDGFSDVIVGADGFDGSETDEGAAFLFAGSASGLASTAAWTALGGQAVAGFGATVAGAGDVNGDGFADLVVGAPGFTDLLTGEGRVFVYHGSGTGPSAVPDWTASGGQAVAGFGQSVATAGDVNGDGYADVLVGAPGFESGETDEGAAFVFYGGSTGLDRAGARPVGNPGNEDWRVEGNQPSAAFGSSVATAGDVNGDGIADVILGADGFGSGEPNEGAAFVYYGSATGLATTAAWTVQSNQASAGFSRVATAGDVNGDGFSDVVVGAPRYDDPSTDEGRAFVYLGSAGGLATAAGWTVIGDQSYGHFGWSVAGAGDVNGDGFSDVIVGADYYDNGETDEGVAFVFLGSPAGLSASPIWRAEGNQSSARFGYSVASAGDVNGDGYGDVIVGAPWYDNDQGDEGRAYVYLGSPAGTLASPIWFAESHQSSAVFGYSVAGAGDVNGDGYGDVLVGSPWYDSSCTDSGRTYIFQGSAAGPSANPDWTTDGGQCYSNLGQSDAGAGDVNGDGYSDIVIGEPYYDSYCGDGGRVLVFHGSAAGLGSNPAWTSGGQSCSELFGWSVSTAGDVNGDGYSDIVVGAPQAYQHCCSNAGRAYVFHGSPGGVVSGPARTLDYCNCDLRFGESVATAGDVNGDGFSDIVIGAPNRDRCYTDEGWAAVYLGSASGISSGYSWETGECGQNYAYLGKSVAGAGDVNGDGYADVLVGAPYWDRYYSYDPDEGRAALYYGNNGPGVALAPRQRRADDSAPIAPFGWSDDETSFRLAASGRSPFGPGRMKFEWEVKPVGTLFDGTGLARGGSWTQAGLAPAALDEPVTGLAPSTAYHWRVRVLYDPATTPLLQRSRWLTGSWNGPQEMDLALPRSAALSLTMTGSPDPYVIGYHTSGIEYTLHVANAGPSMASVSVMDTLSAAATFVSATASQGSCSHAAGVVSCGLGVIGVGGNATVTIVATPTSPGLSTNRAELRTSFIDPDPTDNVAQVQTTVVHAAVGDRVWEDRDGDGIQDPGEPGVVAALVYLFDAGGSFVDVTFTNASGVYRFENVSGGRNYFVRFIPPTGYVLSPANQGNDETDSDADPVTGSTPAFSITGIEDATRWDAGMVPSIPCAPPDERIYVYSVTRSTDGNDFPILHFMDFNQPEQVTGYNVYRSANPGLPQAQWALVGSDVVDGDQATPNNQWVDISGDPPPSQIWYYKVTAYNHRCPAEGPW